MKKLWLILGSYLFCYCTCKGQVGDLSTEITPIRFCKPGVPGMLPGKGLEIFHEYVPGYNLASPLYNGATSQAVDRVNYSYHWGVKLKVPVILKEDFKLLLDTKYARQNYTFERPESIELNLHQNLETQTLKTLRLGAIALKPLDEISYLVARGAMSMNTNRYKDFDFGLSTTVLNLTVLYGRKTQPRKEWGVGLSQSLQFGQYRILPVFMYNETFNEKWGVEMVLPKEAFLRRNFGSRLAAKVGAELDGNTYTLFTEEPGVDEAVQLRQGYARAKIQLEWKINSFVWISCQTGYLQPVSFNTVEIEQDTPLMTTQQGSWFSGFSISLRAPH